MTSRFVSQCRRDSSHITAVMRDCRYRGKGEGRVASRASCRRHRVVGMCARTVALAYYPRVATYRYRGVHVDRNLLSVHSRREESGVIGWLCARLKARLVAQRRCATRARRSLEWRVGKYARDYERAARVGNSRLAARLQICRLARRKAERGKIARVLLPLLLPWRQRWQESRSGLR